MIYLRIMWVLFFMTIFSSSIAGANSPDSFKLIADTTVSGTLDDLQFEDDKIFYIYSSEAKGIGKIDFLYAREGLEYISEVKLRINILEGNTYKLRVLTANKTWEDLIDLSGLPPGDFHSITERLDLNVADYTVRGKVQFQLISSKYSGDVELDQFSVNGTSPPSPINPEPVPPVTVEPVPPVTVEPVPPVTVEPVPPVTVEPGGSVELGMNFYWQLQGALNTNVAADIYDIDLEDNEFNGIIPFFQDQGKVVICYFSAGTYENWRSDAGDFPASSLGNNLDNWPGEKWLDIRNSGVREVIKSRIDRAVQAGCDAIEPDNVDGYQNNNGFGLTSADQIDYLNWMANYSKSKGISIGLKNAVDIISKGGLHKVFDWTLNEECYRYNECENLKSFVDEGKAVFIVEYRDSALDKCQDAKNNKYFLSISNYDLDGKKYVTCE